MNVNFTKKYRVVIASNLRGTIGNRNKLIWNSPEDLEHFKRLTSGQTIVMGRKTFESLGRRLPDRKHIVVSNNVAYRNHRYSPDIVVTDLYEPLLIEKGPLFLIGGAKVLREALALDLVDLIYHTKVHDSSDGDTHIPKFQHSFELISSIQRYDIEPKLDFEIWRKQ